MTGMMRSRTSGLRGFTLIEVLAALLLASVILIAVAALIHDIAGHFDRGARRVNETEQLMLAVDRLAQDFGAARFALRMTGAVPGLAFAADQASGDKPAHVMFVAGGGIMSGPQVEEVISLTVEPAAGVTRLVRRRAAWAGSRMHFEDISLRDAVVLIEGNLDIAFTFGRVTPAGTLEWSQSWTDEPALPRFVRLVLHDRATGADLLGEADFVIRANAPATCGRPDAGTDCLQLAQRPAIPSELEERTSQ
jgi:general secretion pathway protein J